MFSVPYPRPGASSAALVRILSAAKIAGKIDNQIDNTPPQLGGCVIGVLGFAGGETQFPSCQGHGLGDRLK